MRWTRHPSGDVAIDEILDAAGRAFDEVGVAGATMVDVASAAGCSRATLYRYFPSRDALHLGFVHRRTLEIANQLAAARVGRSAASLADRILIGIAAVREDPVLSVFFEPENLAVPMAVSRNSDLLRQMAAGLIDQLASGPSDSSDLERRGEWLLRSIVSLLAMPAADAATERELVERFLVPSLLAPKMETAEIART